MSSPLQTFLLGLACCASALLVRSAPFLDYPPKHVTVYENSGEFAGWPANEGVWSWGNEILVAAWVSQYEEDGSNHNHAPDAPQRIRFSRSLDGGLTWTPEEHDNVRPPRYLGEPAVFTGNINFANPDLAMRWRGNSFFVSADRGQSWEGPYAVPLPENTTASSARTCYFPINESSCLVLSSYSYITANGTMPQVAALKTSDGGASFQLLSWIGPGEAFSDDFTAEDLAAGNIYSIMPQGVQISQDHYIITLRQRITTADRTTNRIWTDVYETSDGGSSWTKISELERNSVNPVSLVYLGEKTLIATYGDRSAPIGIYAKVSHDLGRSWSDKFPLRKDAREWDIGYVVSRLLSDNKIATIYYYTTEQHYPNFIAATVWDPSSIATARPQMSMGNVTIVEDTFSDGDRLGISHAANGTYTSLNWYCRNPTYIHSDQEGITLESAGLPITGQAIGGQFVASPVTLAPGGNITLSFEFTPTNPGASDNTPFCVGLFDSGGSSDNVFSESSLYGTGYTHSGYRGTLIPRGASSMSLERRQDSAGAIIHSDNYDPLSERNISASFSSNVTYQSTLSMERNGESDCKLTWTISGGDLEAPLTIDVLDSNRTLAAVDTIVFCANRNAFAPRIDNIRLTAFAPAGFLRQPESQTLNEYATLTLTASLWGTETLVHQWFKEGFPIEGANGDTFTIAAVRESDAGQYTLLVSNAEGQRLMSETAVITVLPHEGMDWESLTPDERLALAFVPDGQLPSGGSLGHIPQTSVNLESGYPEISFTPFRSELRYEVQESDDLENWTTIQSLDGGESEAATIRATGNLTDSPRRFLRVRVSPR